MQNLQYKAYNIEQIIQPQETIENKQQLMLTLSKQPITIKKPQTSYNHTINTTTPTKTHQTTRACQHHCNSKNKNKINQQKQIMQQPELIIMQYNKIIESKIDYKKQIKKASNMPIISLDYEGKTTCFEFQFNGNTKQFVITQIRQLWGLEFDQIVLSYIDLDGDYINVDNQEDFDVAMQTMPNNGADLNIKVTLNAESIPQFSQVKQTQQVQVEQEKQNQVEEMKQKSDDFHEQIKAKLKENLQVEKKKKLQMQQKKKMEAQAKEKAKAIAKAEAEQKKKQLLQQREAMLKVKQEILKAKQEQKMKKQQEKRQEKERKEAQNKKKQEQKKKKQKNQHNISSSEECAIQKVKQVEEPKKQQKKIDKYLTEEEIRKLVREEILMMVPDLKERILEEPVKKDMKQHKITEYFKKSENGCQICGNELHIPFYFNPQSKRYQCNECESKNTSTQALLKIKDQNHLKTSYYTYAGVLKTNQLNQNPDNYQKYIEQARVKVVTKIKQDFKLKIQEKKKQIKQKEAVKN